MRMWPWETRGRCCRLVLWTFRRRCQLPPWTVLLVPDVEDLVVVQVLAGGAEAVQAVQAALAQLMEPIVYDVVDVVP